MTFPVFVSTPRFPRVVLLLLGRCAQQRLSSIGRGRRVPVTRKGPWCPTCCRHTAPRSPDPGRSISVAVSLPVWGNGVEKKCAQRRIAIHSKTGEAMGRQPFVARSMDGAHVAAPAATTTKPLGIRRYRRDGDKDAVVEICRDVYDGRDYIPRVIDSYGTETDVLVEAPSASDPPRALLCGARDGSLYHIWGARTHPSARGQGIMRRMMRHVEAIAGTTLISTTIRSNTSMLRLFESEGYTEYENEIKLWPDSSVTQEENCTIMFALDHHARAHQRRQDGAYQNSLEPCPSVEDLRRGLRDVRGAGRDLWLPSSYEVISTDGEVAQSAIGDGDVFVSEDLNAVVAIVGDQLGGTVLSIVCTSTTLGGVLGAVAARVRDRAIKRMYVDLCGTELSPADFVHGCERGWASYIVLTKAPDEQPR